MMPAVVAEAHDDRERQHRNGPARLTGSTDTTWNSPRMKLGLQLHVHLDVGEQQPHERRARTETTNPTASVFDDRAW